MVVSTSTSTSTFNPVLYRYLEISFQIVRLIFFLSLSLSFFINLLKDTRV